MSSSPTYCVVGGGISGLVAAYRLRVAAGPDAAITIFDPADRLGGVLRTERVGGQLVDVGAEVPVPPSEDRRERIVEMTQQVGTILVHLVSARPFQLILAIAA